MKVSLIVPAAGQSSRFPGMRKKYLLTAPDGKSMLHKSLEGLDLRHVNKIYITILEEDEKQYGALSVINEIRSGFPNQTIKAVILKQSTNSQVETVCQTLLRENISGPIAIKDADNYFRIEVPQDNYVSVVDLRNLNGKINAGNKSYVTVDDFLTINNIVEKEVLSNFFCCGLYSFLSTQMFLEHAQGSEYISHVIYSMLLDNHVFDAQIASDYEDFGDLESWQKYRDSFRTYFIDLDGILFRSDSNLSDSEIRFLPNNLKKLQELSQNPRVQLIFTTARPDSEELREILKKNSLIGQFCTNLFHAKRILINDYAPTNPYPSAEAINIVRNSDNLDQIL